MTINELRYLLTIVEEGSINKAAEKLYISQSALSKCVKRMEAEYGIYIFERKQGSKLSLSKEGKLLLRFAQKVNEANSEFKNFKIIWSIFYISVLKQRIRSFIIN